MFVLLLLVSGATPACGQHQLEFHVAPLYGFHFGDTRFDLQFNYLRPDSSIGIGKSELVFPLDVTQAGFEIGFRSVQNNHSVLTAGVRLVFSVSDPAGKMTDRDWIGDSFSMFEFSSTESTADGNMVSIEFEVTRLLTAGPGWELAGLVGLEYQHIKQQIVDLKGWQYDIDQVVLLERPDQLDSLQRFYFDVEVLAGTYEVRFFRPQIGLVPRFQSGSFSAVLQAAICPLLHVRDIDDHVLRYFQIRTEGKGFGYSGRLAFKYESSGQKKFRTYGSLIGEFTKAAADVSGYREYYANCENDPDDPDDDIMAGTWFPEEHEITSTQYGVRILVGLRF